MRVYPDQVHVDSHERELTAGELDWGQHFWQQIWRAGTDEGKRRAAWQQLADRFDAAARGVDRPRAEPDQRARARPGRTRHAALCRPWCRAPRAVPTAGATRRWRARCRNAGSRSRARAARWSAHAQSLPVDASPRSAPASASDTVAAPSGDGDARHRRRHALDGRLRRRRAARHGAAHEAADGGGAARHRHADRVRRRHRVDPTRRAAPSSRALLDAHHYTDGLGFLRTGTPTNNTRRGGLRAWHRRPRHARSFDALVPRRAAEPRARQQGRAPRARVRLRRRHRARARCGALEGASAREQLDARQMATALWPATWGYYLGNLIGLDGTGLTLDAIAWAREHFIAHVRAFGPLPTLRVGRQPYGVLPVTLLADWTPRVADDPRREPRAAPARPAEDACATACGAPRIDGVPRVGRAASNTDAEIGVGDADRRHRRRLPAAASARAALSAAPAQLPRRGPDRERLARGARRADARRAAAARLHLAPAAGGRGLRADDRCRSPRRWCRATRGRVHPGAARRAAAAAARARPSPLPQPTRTRCCTCCCATRCSSSTRPPRAPGRAAPGTPHAGHAAARRRADQLQRADAGHDLAHAAGAQDAQPPATQTSASSCARAPA